MRWGPIAFPSPAPAPKPYHINSRAKATLGCACVKNKNNCHTVLGTLARKKGISILKHSRLKVSMQRSREDVTRSRKKMGRLALNMFPNSVDCTLNLAGAWSLSRSCLSC